MARPKRRGRWLRRLLRIITGFFLLCIIACFVFDHFIQLRKSDKELKKFFSDNKIAGKIGYYISHGRRLRYVAIGSDTLPTLLYIHGSPSSMSLYRGRFSDSTILHTFRVLAVDRPGYGYSGLGHPEPSIQKQSEMISDLLDSVYKVTHPVIIVGGSFGAPIACRLAMDHPELVDGLVLTGPAIGPGREKYFGLHLLLKAHLSAGLFQEFLNRQTRKNYITKKNWKKCFRTGKIFVSRLCICREQRIIL